MWMFDVNAVRRGCCSLLSFYFTIEVLNMSMCWSCSMSVTLFCEGSSKVLFIFFLKNNVLYSADSLSMCLEQIFLELGATKFNIYSTPIVV